MTEQTVLSRKIEEEIRKRAENTYPEEGCGVLLGTARENRITEIKELPNAADPEHTGKYFEIDPLVFLNIEREAEEKNLGVIGVYHTHPDHAAVPSKEDEMHMVPGLTYLILSVVQGKCREIRGYRKERSGDPVAEIEIGEATS